MVNRQQFIFRFQAQIFLTFARWPANIVWNIFKWPTNIANITTAANDYIRLHNSFRRCRHAGALDALRVIKNFATEPTAFPRHTTISNI